MIRLKHSKRILIAPLNWGLGHATRCIPIINELLHQNCEVLLASDGRALNLLKKEFPTLPHFKLPSYDIHYPTKSMILNLAYQGPKIIQTIWQEKKVIEKLIETEQIDIILSDNRFVFYSKKIKSIFITHQINIKTPISFFDQFIAIINHYLIKKFDECWIPDFENNPNLAGSLAHKTNLKKKV
jgi:UDP:flavonoid glycosyltransferase YjiC (YdhE family)